MSKKFMTVVASLVLAAAAPSSAGTSPDRLYATGQRELQAGHFGAAQKAFSLAAALNPSAANWRALANAYRADGKYADATRAYDEAIRRYRQQGDLVTALALDHLAAPYRQELSLYAFGPASGLALPHSCTAEAAKFEPDRGILLGTYVDELRQRANGNIDVTPLKTSDFAVYFRYWTLKRPGGEVFPTAFAASVRRAHGALHLALEPGLPLSEIDDRVLVPFAEAAKKADLPIFVRFAAEFNDPVNPWSRDPALYRQTFRRVAQTLHRLAPNVAMVWMPMASRLETVDAYYPGADAVDWVGVSLYSVPYPNGDTRQGVDTSNPIDQLRGFYDKYACRHPFQVSEYASANRSGAAPGQDLTPFAVDRMRELYWGAALTLPRLKNINWLDVNVMTSAFVAAKTGVRRNDYRLFEIPAKLAVFRAFRDEAVFLKSWPGVAANEVPLPFPNIVAPGAPLRGAVWLKTFRPAARVEIRLDQREIPAESTLPYRFVLPLSQLTPGSHTLTVRAVDGSGSLLVNTVRTFQVPR